MGWRWCDGFPQLQGGGGGSVNNGVSWAFLRREVYSSGAANRYLWGSEFPGARFVGCELTAWLRCASFFAFIGRYVAFYRIFRILPLPEVRNWWSQVTPTLTPTPALRGRLRLRLQDWLPARSRPPLPGDGSEAATYPVDDAHWARLACAWQRIGDRLSGG